MITLLISLIMQYLSVPESYVFENEDRLQEKYSFEDFDAEYLIQRNGPDTWQKVLIVFPKNSNTRKCPAVVVPFYFPEAMIGFDLETGQTLDKFKGVEMMLHLVRRGFICISAESYHLTYCPDLNKDRDDFSRWQDSAMKLMSDYPMWCGIGKLVADTRLLIDLLERNPRVDTERIGIAGHSLGGKMAFYTGCVDPRIKVILASDFGLLWDQTNWEKIWYWGEKLEILRSSGVDNVDLWKESGCKPFFLIAGESDDDTSVDALKICANEFADFKDGSLGFLNHASGHRPPQYALDAGYDFIDRYL